MIERLRRPTKTFSGVTETIGDATLILGDCAEVLPTLGKVDAVITDPPFEIEAHTYQRRTGSPGKLVNDPLDFAPITPELRAAIPEWASHNCEGWLLAFCQIEALHLWREEFEKSGCSYRRALIWVKTDGMPQWTGDRPGMGYETIASAWCGGGRSHWNGGGRAGVFHHHKRGDSVREHKTQKPESLMIELVSLFSQPGEVVVDPFMGAGSTGIACLRTGRKFIGIELDEKHFQTSVRRIKREYGRGDFLRPRGMYGKQGVIR